MAENKAELRKQGFTPFVLFGTETDGTKTAAKVNSSGQLLVSLANMPLIPRGAWDANANSPVLADGDGETAGSFYVVSVAGSQDLGSGSISFDAGDWVLNNSSNVWQKIDNPNVVVSVFGRTGPVTAQAGDYNATQVGLGNVTNDVQMKAIVSVDNEVVRYTGIAGQVQQGAGVTIDDTGNVNIPLAAKYKANAKNVLSIDAGNVISVGDSISTVKVGQLSLTAGGVIFPNGTGLETAGAVKMKMFSDRVEWNTLGIAWNTVTKGLADVNLFRTDAGNDAVLIGTPTFVSGFKFIENGNALIQNNNSISAGVLTIWNKKDPLADNTLVETMTIKGPDRATPADNDRFIISYEAKNSAGAFVEIARDQSRITDVTAGNINSDRSISFFQNGVLTPVMTIGFDNAGLGVFRINGTGLDYNSNRATELNARFRSDSEDNCGFLDTSTDSWGFGISSSILAKVHIRQNGTAAAKPVLSLTQLDVSEEFIRFRGTAASAVLTQSIVNVSDVLTETTRGYLKIVITDDGNQVTDGDYFIPFVSIV